MREARDEFRQVLRNFLGCFESGSDDLDVLTDDLLEQLLAPDEGWLLLGGQVHEITDSRWQSYTDTGQVWTITTEGH